MAVADFDGYVHVLDAATGELAARTDIGSQRVSAAPVVVGDLAIFIDDDGKISALRAAPKNAEAAR